MSDERRRATAVVLLRRSNSGELEVYLTRRSERLAFLGGFHAFAGGSVDSTDSDAPMLEQTSQPAADELQALKSCAVRELLEETGVLAACLGPSPSAHARAELRRRVLADGSSWPTALRELGLRIDARELLAFGRWITPPFSPIRFDARYFAVWLPRDQEPAIWPGELTDGLWRRPSDAIREHEDGGLYLSYPVLETLVALARHQGDVSAAAADMEGRGAEAYPHAGGEIFSGIHIAPLRTITLPPATHTNTYLLGVSDLIIVDPATPFAEEQERLLSYVRHLQSSGAKVRELWLTHHHPDHVGAAARLRDELGVPIAAHALTRDALAGELGIDRLIEDGETTRLPLRRGREAVWVALHTPGHARGHLCFHEQRSKALLTGDMVAGMGTILVAPPDGDMSDYLDSLRRLQALPLGFMFPAHGTPLAATRAKLQEYLDHRLARERAVLESLDQPRTPEEIVRHVYLDVPVAAHGFARGNVQAHLDKLEREGLVTSEQERYRRL